MTIQDNVLLWSLRLFIRAVRVEDGLDSDTERKVRLEPQRPGAWINTR